MMSRSHTLLGVLAGAGLARVGLFDLSAPVIAGLVLGSVAPDIDTPFSALGRILPFISGPLYLTIGHRTATHSVYGVTIVIMTAFLVQELGPWPWLVSPAIAFMVGYLIHVAADLLTIEGCALAYPYPRRYCVWPAVRTGGFGELVLVAAIAIPAIHFLAPPLPVLATSFWHLIGGLRLAL